MALAFGLATFSIALLLSCSVHPTLGGGEEATTATVTCEKLGQGACAYAVSSTGKRCVLEKRVKLRCGTEEYSCRTSEIEADDKLNNLVETDECVKACGLERKVLGISSDALLEPGFTRHLCSPQCYDACPNIIDLYFNLAAGEGVFLPNLCATKEGRKGGERRELMGEINSSGGGVMQIIAPGPVDAMSYMISPSTAPAAPMKTVEAYADQFMVPVPAPEPVMNSADDDQFLVPVPAQGPVMNSGNDDQFLVPVPAPGPVMNSVDDAPSPAIYFNQ
ncbi:hypothetical protein LINGRAHAP2_LOCUS6397 [Linum grandiflorum]